MLLCATGGASEGAASRESFLFVSRRLGLGVAFRAESEADLDFDLCGACFFGIASLSKIDGQDSTDERARDTMREKTALKKRWRGDAAVDTATFRAPFIERVETARIALSHAVVSRESRR